MTNVSDNTSRDITGRDIIKKKGGIHLDNVSAENIEIVGRDKLTVYQGLTTEEVAVLVAELKRVDQPPVWDGRIPYIGLSAFQESDAQFFFGRESLVDDLLQRVTAAKFIVIAGPSGSGKSSVARAGLFHALRDGRLPKSDSWRLATLLPGGNPLEQLAIAIERLTHAPGSGNHIRHNGLENPLALHEQIQTLLSDDPGQRFVLLVDQFEELFTQTKDEAAREAFIHLLTTAAQTEGSRAIILLSLRSDFISHCARYPDLRELMSRQFQLVGAMEPHDLAKAITLPALEVGAEIDPALVSRIMADMKGEPGALPLMSFALRDLFEVEKTAKGQPMDMTLPEYLQRGGIESALERHANQVFANFSEEQKELAKAIFSRLIEIGQGRQDTRRTAVFTELIPAGKDAAAVTAVVDALAREGARLLTASGGRDDEAGTPTEVGASTETTVTIAHEKLIDAWPWLRQLVDENREAIALQNQIANDAQAWAKDKDAGYLYRGGRLAQVGEKLGELAPHLDSLSQQFIEASVEQRRREQWQKQRNLALVIGLLLLLFIGSAVAALRFNEQATENERIAKAALAAEALAETRASEAEQSQAQAEQEVKINFARQLNAQAQIVTEKSNPIVQALLAVEGVSRLIEMQIPISFQDRNALQNALHLLPRETKILVYNESRIVDLAFSQRDDASLWLITLSEIGEIHIIDVQSGEIVYAWQHPEHGEKLEVSPHGAWLTTKGPSKIVLWDLYAGQIRHEFSHDKPQSHISFSNYLFRLMDFSHDERYLASIINETDMYVWDTLTGNIIYQIDHPSAESVDFAPDRHLLAIAGGGFVRLWDLQPNQLGPTLQAELELSDAYGVQLVPQQRKIIVTGGGRIMIWRDDLQLLEVSLSDFNSSWAMLTAFAVSDDGRHLTYGFGENVGIYPAIAMDLNTHTELARTWHDATVNSLGFTNLNGESFLSTEYGSVGRITRIKNGREVARVIHQGSVIGAVSPDGQWVATTGDRDTAVFLWRPEAGSMIEAFSLAVQYGDTDFAQSLRKALARKTLTYWDVNNNNQLATIMDMSFDGQLVAVVELDNSVTVRYTENPQQILLRVPYHRMAWDVTFSPDGSLLALARGDQVVQVWDIITRALVLQPTYADDLLDFARFDETGERLITTSTDYTGHIWALLPQDLLEEACRRLPRNFTIQEWETYLGEEPYRQTCPNLPVPAETLPEVE